ncbi:OmpA family protein [Paraburkholderia solisilvae]|uniref:OmpA family protein n=1 Tax=Paraburkholderia solisilvae TaxID=624376 RepID=UPI0035EAEA72
MCSDASTHPSNASAHYDHAQAGLGYPFRTVVLFAAVLALAVLWLVLPCSRATASVATGAIGLLALGFVRLRTRRLALARTGNAHVLQALGSAAAHIPVQLRTRMPLVLVVGDGLPELFDRDGEARFAHVGDGAVWLRADRHRDLPRLSVAVRQWRDGRAPDGIVLSIAPALHSGVDMLVQQLRTIREALSDASRMLGARLPAYIAVYQRSASARNRFVAVERSIASASGSAAQSASSAIDIAAPQWYGVSSSKPFAPQMLPVDTSQWHATVPAGEPFESIIQAAEAEACQTRAACVCAARAAALASLVNWTRRIVLGTLTDRRQPSRSCPPYGVGWIDCGPATGAGKPWERDVESHTSVAPVAVSASPSPWPLPQPLIEAMPRRPYISPRLSALAHMLALAACAAAVAFWGAASNNAHMIDRIGADLARYARIPAAHDTARRDALLVLVADRDRLDRFARLGVPLQLSFGMYRGTQLLPLLNDAIASWQPPTAPPTVVTLDSMSLFDSGSAQLKPGSTRAMISALDMIKSNPGKRILVAGYTDALGNPDSNLKLSLARAAAVRDWLIDASGMSATRFAIQGYGDTRPIANNDTPEGRARNRRVDITLVSDAAR